MVRTIVGMQLRRWKLLDEVVRGETEGYGPPHCLLWQVRCVREARCAREEAPLRRWRLATKRADRRKQQRAFVALPICPEED